MKHKKNNKTIFLVSNMYPSKQFPHYGVFVQNVEKQLEQDGFNIINSAMSKSSNKFEKIIKYFLFYLITIIKGLFCRYDYLYAHYASHTAMPLLILKFLRPSIKIIMNVHGNDIVPEDEHDEKFINVVKKILNKSDKIISPSTYFKTILVNDYDIQENKIVVYPSAGVNLDIFQKKVKEACLKKLGLDSKYKYIGYVSRIEKNKGWDTLLKAIKELDSSLPENYRFIFVGSGSEESDFQKMVADLKIGHRIIKFDFLSQIELSYVYNCLELFCFPTYRKSESLGLVALEAMACECPVLAANNYGPTSYIEDGINGTFFKSQDYIDLKNKIIECLNYNKNQKLEMKINSLKTAYKYSTYNIKNIIINVFSKNVDTVKKDDKKESSENQEKKISFNKLEKLIYILFVLSLIVDNVNGYLINSKINLPISVGQIFRFILLVITLYGIFLFPKKNIINNIKKYKYLIFLYFGLFFLCIIYALIHGFNLGNLFEDVLYVTKLLFPISVIVVLVKLKNEKFVNDKYISSVFSTYSILAPLTIIIPTILGVSFSSYQLGGVKGFYVANNEVNIVLVCTFIYTFNKLFKRFNLKYLLLVAINAIALLMIGSKTSMLTVVLTILIYMLRLLKQPKKFIIFVIIFLIISGISMLFIGDILSDSMERIRYFYKTLTQDGTIIDFLTSTRSKRIIPILDKHVFSQGAIGVLSFFIGVGRSNQFQENVLSSIIEMDFFDTLIWYGAITAIIIAGIYMLIFIKNFKKKNIFEFKLMFTIVFLFSLIAGHVWFSPLSGGMFALVCVAMVYLGRK